MTTNTNSIIRTDFNTLNVGELFTTKTLTDSSNTNAKDVSNYIFRVRELGCCAIHGKEDGRTLIYKKIKDDTTITRDSHSHKRKANNQKEVIKHIPNKYPNLNFKVEGTDAEIVDKLLPFVSNLKQMVIDLTDELNSIKDQNKELLSDNDTLCAEIDELRRNLPRLQEEVKEYRKTKAIRTITI